MAAKLRFGVLFLVGAVVLLNFSQPATGITLNIDPFGVGVAGNVFGRQCTQVGQSCRWNSDCCSNDCTFSKCRGSATQCANIGQACSWDRECCSGDCAMRKCRGSAAQCAWTGDACTWDRECCSKRCSFRKCAR